MRRDHRQIRSACTTVNHRNFNKARLRFQGLALLPGGEDLKRPAGVAFKNSRVQIGRLRQRRKIPRRRVQKLRGARDADAQPVRNGMARPERLNIVHLAEHIARVLEEPCAALRRTDAPAGALENAEAKRLLQIVQDAAQIRLAEKEVFRRLRNGACAFDLNDIL